MKGGFSLLISSSGRMWLGSTVLAGILLASSLSVPETGKVAANSVSISLSTGSYTKTIRTQFHWKNPSITTSDIGKSAEKTNSTVVQVPTTRPETIQSEPVQVANASQSHVSRSDSYQLIANALSLQGVPYRFGGTSRSGFDCSGFTQYVYRAVNTSLPRTAAEQFRVGASVSRGQLQVGDFGFLFNLCLRGLSRGYLYWRRAFCSCLK